jgi:hypothetical protein
MCVLYHCDTASYYFLISESFSGFSKRPLLKPILLKFLRLDDETYTAQAIWWGNLMARYHFQYLHLDRRVILKGILKKCDAGMDLINLSQDRKM